MQLLTCLSTQSILGVLLRAIYNHIRIIIQQLLGGQYPNYRFEVSYVAEITKFLDPEGMGPTES